MLRFKLLILNLLVVSGLYSQVQKGTFYIAGICKEGIVLVGDSRASYKDTVSDQVGAYYDGVLKVYKYRNLAFGMTGTVSFGSLMFSEIFLAFVRENNFDIEPDKFLFKFFSFASNKMEKPAFSALSKNVFLICGFRNMMPMIIYHDQKIDSVFTKPGDYKTTDNDQQHYPQLETVLSNSTLQKASEELETATAEYLKKKNEHEASDKGGPLTSLGLTMKGSVYFKIADKYFFTNYQQFLKAYKKNNIDFHYRSIADSFTLRRILR